MQDDMDVEKGKLKAALSRSEWIAVKPFLTCGGIVAEHIHAAIAVEISDEKLLVTGTPDPDIGIDA